jgi:prevent-host-death family protein
MHIWRLHEAKNRFSEVVELTLNEGPQMVTRRGKEAVVILAVDEYRRLIGQPS